ncbi:hypothetical protein ACIA8O_04605 [Kitasatospora sp. NPDC051853]|uniref:hypothetical protein n=1 Tax=Kitasatospora sp. NPDC051853 TaxID=3364058 RepID=UPI0037BC5688
MNQHYGDNIHLHGGTNNTGKVVHHHPPAADPPQLAAALLALAVQLRELQAALAPLNAQVVAESLAVIEAPAPPAQERRRALLAVAGIAATVGAVGAPVAEAVQRVLALLG